MAINFLTGLNIDGNIDLNSNQLKEVRIENRESLMPFLLFCFLCQAAG